MGRPPAYIFVVRHGHRLDAADKQWHLSSPAPYDPPLTYNGWLQTQALGAKISTILRERVQADEAAAASDPNRSSTKPRRRKYQVVVHSSPFLRCVQTSIGLSAGIANDPTPLRTNGRIPPIDTLNLGSADVDGGRPGGGASASANRTAGPVELHDTGKAILRLDAFLGEWLTPSYFELITPPPESVMMLATAKADLLRPEKHQASFSAHATHVHSNSQGHLWGASPRTSPVTSSPTSPHGSDNLPSGALSRSSSLSSQHTPTSASFPVSTPRGGYVAPKPHYAISSNNTIPQGYVAHARDACVKVDYQWDSMRGPLECGDGGKFGEEWTEMHRRFRNGMQHLVDWYASAEHPTEMVTRTARWTAGKTTDGADCAVEDDPDDDDETEAIVVLVSHGAGCNALIGALTHQPVLMDVHMASLTMAVRKSEEEMRMAEQNHAHNSKPNGKIPIHDYYDLKILASTEHLRSTSQSPSLSRTPSASAGARGRFTSPLSTAFANNHYGDLGGGGSRATSASAALTNSRRPSGTNYSAAAEQRGGITVGSGVTSFSTRRPSSGLSRTPSIGLWSPLPTKSEEEDEDEDDDSMVLNFSHERAHPAAPAQAAATTSGAVAAPASAQTESESAALPPAAGGDVVMEDGTAAKENGPSSGGSGGGGGGLAKSQSEAFLDRKGDETPRPGQAGPAGAGAGVLWGGGPRPPGEAERIRDLSSTKRRWTVNTRWRGDL